MIALKFLYAENENIYPAYVSKHNSKRKMHSSFDDSKGRNMALFSEAATQKCFLEKVF